MCVLVTNRAGARQVILGWMDGGGGSVLQTAGNGGLPAATVNQERIKLRNIDVAISPEKEKCRARKCLALKQERYKVENQLDRVAWVKREEATKD